MNTNNIRKNVILGFILLFSLCTVFKLKVYAADNYQITENNGILTGMCNDSVMQDVYVCIKKEGNTHRVVKPGTKDSRVYYFNRIGDGALCPEERYVGISYGGNSRVYYCNKGVLEKNKIVGNKEEGYFYVDSTGVRVNDKTTNLAVKFVRAHTKAKDSKSKKLKKCYYYLSRHYSYKRTYTNLYPKAKHMNKFALEMFKNKEGNCHRYAACFAYIARVLGYDTRVVVGKISGYSGGMTPHGWTEVKKDGKWYACDPDMEMNGVDSYMKRKTPCVTSVTRRCKITVKNGKVSWK